MTSSPRDIQDTSVGGGNPLNLTVGVTSSIVLRDKPTRKKAHFTNDSANVIYLAKFQQAVLNAGIRLNASGGALIDEPDFNGYIYTGPWAAIATGAASSLCIQEN